jgi:hypothetical protein
LSEFLKIAAGRAHGLRESFRKLPRARRISLLLGGAALAALSVLPFTGRGRDPLPETSAAGALERGEAAPAGAAARESDLEPAPPSLWETPRQVEERSREHNRRRVEQAIEENPRIARARLVLSRAQPARSALQRAAEDSAAVTLTLAPGVRQLDREEADSIRSIVECAFNVRPERVSMTDNFPAPTTRSPDSARVPGSSRRRSAAASSSSTAWRSTTRASSRAMTSTCRPSCG